MQHTYLTHSPAETEAVGRAFAERLRAEGKTSAMIALRGELGVGKTAFTRGFVSAFGSAHAKSPTYTVVNEYRTQEAVIFHFDMYRVESEDDLFSIGFDDYVAKRAFILIEWSERIQDCLPNDRYTVTVARTSVENPDDRCITFDAPVQ